MKADINSWHRHLNDFVYGSGYSLSNQNFCLYFWGTLPAIIFLIPTAIIKAIQYIIPLKYRKNIGIGGFFTLLGGTMIFGLITDLNFTLQILIIAGITIGMIFSGLVITILAHVGYRKIRSSKNIQQNPNMLIEMFKAWKNKHCPRLEWV